MLSMGVKVREEPAGSGNWCIKIDYKGSRKHVTVGSDKRLANRMAKEIEAKLLLGQIDFEKPKVNEQATPTLKHYVDGWNDNDGAHPGWIKKTKKKLKYSTIKGYENILKQRFIPKWGSTPINEIHSKDIDDYMYELSEPVPIKDGKTKPGLKPNTLANIKNTLGAVLKQAVKDGYITSNPAHEIEIPRAKDVQEPEPNPFTWDERETIEKTFKKKHPRYYALIATGFRSGLRIGELIGLRVGDLDFHNGVIEVQNNITRSRETTPKSKTSKRKVRMSKDLKEILQHQVKAVKEEALRKKWSEVPQWVFVNEDGTYINYYNFVPRVWNKAIEESKLSRRTPHDMRHTYATMRLSAGHPVHEVAKELGHSTPVITYKVYYKFIPSISMSNIDEIDGKNSAKIRKPDANEKDA